MIVRVVNLAGSTGKLGIVVHDILPAVDILYSIP
jgi:hypothetical protein